VALVVIVGIPFGLVASEHGTAYALNVLLGIQPPVSSGFVDATAADGGPAAVALSIVGYLVVPAIIGSSASLMFGSAISRNIARRQAPLKNLEDRVARLEAKAE
jgi:hypothetical protein